MRATSNPSGPLCQLRKWGLPSPSCVSPPLRAVGRTFEFTFRCRDRAMRAAPSHQDETGRKSRRGKAPPVHLHERRTRRPNRRSPALNRPRPKWKPSCESRSSTTGRGTLPRSAGTSTASRRQDDAGRRKNRDSVWSAAYRPYRTRAAARRAPKSTGHPEGGGRPSGEARTRRAKERAAQQRDQAYGQPRLSDNTPDPSRGPVGIDPPKTHTFLQTILLPEPIRKGKKAKGRPRPEKVKQPVRKARKPKEPRKPSRG